MTAAKQELLQVEAAPIDSDLVADAATLAEARPDLPSAWSNGERTAILRGQWTA